MKFLSPLRVECVSERCWIVNQDFHFSVDGKEHIVPTGYETDWASVPRIPFAYLVAGNISHRAPLCHDFLYTTSEDRKWADLVLMAALEEEGVPAWKRWLMYYAVRAFGRAEFQRRP